MTHSSLERIAEVIQEVIESEIASQLEDLKSEFTDLTNQVDGLDTTVTEVKEGYDEQTSITSELVDDERVRELIRDFVNDGGIEIVTT
jgi:hypothetical protein